jgi:hypothetical protein
VSEENNSAQNIVDDIYGRMAAIDFVVKRLLASHAEMFPNGVAARMIDSADDVVASLDAIDGISPGQLVAMKHQLQMMLRDGQWLPRDQ